MLNGPKDEMYMSVIWLVGDKVNSIYFGFCVCSIDVSSICFFSISLAHSSILLDCFVGVGGDGVVHLFWLDLA